MGLWLTCSRLCLNWLKNWTDQRDQPKKGPRLRAFFFSNLKTKKKHGSRVGQLQAQRRLINVGSLLRTLSEAVLGTKTRSSAWQICTTFGAT